MVKKIKEVLQCMFFLLSGFLYVTAAEVTLELKNVDLKKGHDGKDVPTVGLNQLFDIDIIIKDASQKSDRIAIQGLEAVQVMQQNRSSSMQMVNGVSTSQTTYSITVQAKSEGFFTIGPAQIELDGKIVSSNTVMFDVKKNHTPSSGQQGAGQVGQPSVLCKISIDKKNVVVGEPVVLTLSVYRHGSVLEMGLDKVSFDGFLSKEIEGRTERNEVIDGVSYQVQEMKYTLTPLQEGTKLIKPVVIHYLVQLQRKRNAQLGQFGFGAIEAFFGQQSEQRHATSNDLQVAVSALPDHKGQVHGIGDFSSFTASINKYVADLHEPLTLSLSIEGTGNFEQIAIPSLHLARGFKSYSSKTETLPTAQGTKKQFDFIVQATNAGTVQIPPQTFTYFDVKTRTFKTLKTSPISLEINTPDDYQQAPMPSPKKADAEQQTPKSPQQEVDVLGQVQSLVKSHTLSLPWWLFLVLLLTPLLIFRQKIFALVGYVVTRLFGTRIHKRTIALFDKELDAMIKKGDAASLYQLFLKFLATKSRISVDSITQDWIEHFLQDAHWPEEKREEFLEFLSTCAQLQFMKSKSSSIDQNSLLKKSKYWLIMLNK